MAKGGIRWVIGVKANPPDFIKKWTVKYYTCHYKPSTFVETGTFRGAMIDEVKLLYKKIYSVELDPSLYIQAKNKFANEDRITILEGDSASVLPKIMEKIDDRCLFWLDAHYSGIMGGVMTAKGGKDTPIIEELAVIAKHKIKNHVLLIDDAIDFQGNSGYPTMNEFESFISHNFPNHAMRIKFNIIRVYPR